VHVGKKKINALENLKRVVEKGKKKKKLKMILYLESEVV
jgi:hypothetical protein